jgi:SAM-dependent methyltransferase
MYLADIRFLVKLLDAYSPIDVHKIFEVACGNCPHGRILATMGYDVVGIDNSKAMLEAAYRNCAEFGANVELYLRSSERFKLPTGTWFDAAICLAETLPCGFAAETGDQFNESMLMHFKCMARVLKPGGLYVLDFGRRGQLYNPKRYPITVDYPGEWLTTKGAVVYRQISTPADDVYNNIHYTVQRCVVLFEDGTVIHTYDKWKEPWQLPLPYLSALARQSGAFRLLSAHEWQEVEPGLALASSNYVWVVLQRI